MCRVFEAVHAQRSPGQAHKDASEQEGRGRSHGDQHGRSCVLGQHHHDGRHHTHPHQHPGWHHAGPGHRQRHHQHVQFTRPAELSRNSSAVSLGVCRRRGRVTNHCSEMQLNALLDCQGSASSCMASLPFLSQPETSYVESTLTHLPCFYTFTYLPSFT